MTAQTIQPEDLVAMDGFVDDYPIKIDVVYAQGDHPRNIFGCAIYKPDAKIWLYRPFANIVLRAAQICFERTGYVFELKDGLRPIEAQAAMQETDIVKANPHWMEEPDRLLSPPGHGGHPRGMAIDIVLLDKTGTEIDMGTEFDYLSEDRQNNPAARNYRGFSAEVLQNRKILEDAMLDAAAELGQEVLPLPSEWWDFRYFKDFYTQFTPLRDTDLPTEMKVCNV